MIAGLTEAEYHRRWRGQHPGATAEATARYRRKLRVSGLCSCSRERDSGKSHCKRCRSARAGEYAILKAAGLCSRCRAIAESGKTKCTNCLRRASVEGKKLHKDRKAYGLCARCGAVDACQGQLMCQDCANKSAKVARRWYARTRSKILARYGGECVCCGEDNSQFLDFDHTRNNGAEHRQQLNTPNIMAWLLKHDCPGAGETPHCDECAPYPLQLLCSNCNQAKTRYGKCPHEEES